MRVCVCVRVHACVCVCVCVRVRVRVLHPRVLRLGWTRRCCWNRRQHDRRYGTKETTQSTAGWSRCGGTHASKVPRACCYVLIRADTCCVDTTPTSPWIPKGTSLDPTRKSCSCGCCGTTLSCALVVGGIRWNTIWQRTNPHPKTCPKSFPALVAVPGAAAAQARRCARLRTMRWRALMLQPVRWGSRLFQTGWSKSMYCYHRESARGH